MAISRDKKQALIDELTRLFDSAKGVASATYTNLTVSDMQDLRKIARENGVKILVVKNRLVKVALKQDKRFKDADLSDLKNQLLYAFSEDDEVAPSQVLAKFAKTNDNLKLVAGFSADGTVLSTPEVVALSVLPTKDQLRGQLVSVIAAPLTQLMGVLNGSQRGFVQVLTQKSEQ